MATQMAPPAPDTATAALEVTLDPHLNTWEVDRVALILEATMAAAAVYAADRIALELGLDVPIRRLPTA